MCLLLVIPDLFGIDFGDPEKIGISYGICLQVGRFVNEHFPLLSALCSGTLHIIVVLAGIKSAGFNI